ncbi:MAG: acyl-CoA dehydrogenase family protein, partial [Paracoccaceae bacterium]
EALPRALTAPDEFAMIAGAAKLRASEAAGMVAAIAHQTHGAIGFTQEYRLHPLTRRLWAWRDEYGSEGFWAERLGAAGAAAGADRFWPALTALDNAEDAA